MGAGVERGKESPLQLPGVGQRGANAKGVAVRFSAVPRVPATVPAAREAGPAPLATERGREGGHS